MDRKHLLDVESSRTFRIVAQQLELRAADPATPDVVTWTGYACVTGYAYPIYGGEWPGWMETIAPGAFKKTLSEGADVAFLVNHEGMTLARTKSGTMTLTEDDHGLRVEANLDRRNDDVNDLWIAAERGDVDEMSFAFRVVRDEWFDEEGEPSNAWEGVQRSITEINLNKGDVSAVNYGANDATTGDFSQNQLAHAFAELRAGRPLDGELRALMRDIVDGHRDDTPEPPVEYPLDLALARAAAGKARRR